MDEHGVEVYLWSGERVSARQFGGVFCTSTVSDARMARRLAIALPFSIDRVVATRLGMPLCDRADRVNGIIPTLDGRAAKNPSEPEA